MELISKVADSLAIGDICSKLNFINGNRSLMGYQVGISMKSRIIKVVN
jgi:hypothetical protein